MKKTFCIAIFVSVLALSETPSAGQIPVGAGSQLGQDYLQARKRKSTGDTVRESMIVSWVQGFVVGYARGVTEPLVAQEVLDRIQHGDLPPDVDQALSDPQGRLLAMLQAKFGTRSGWVFDPPDSKAIESWLTKYCQRHPWSRISEAAAALTDELEAHSKVKR